MIKPDAATLFNHQLMRTRKHRAAPHFASADFLKALGAERIADAISTMSDTFERALDIGCHTGEMGRNLPESAGVKQLIQTDDSNAFFSLNTPTNPAISTHNLQTSSEALPFAEGAFDLITSAFSLHHLNDLVGALIQIRRSLKPNGLFVATIPGPMSFHELRESLTHADIATSGGVRPHISPFPEIRDAGALLSRAGFALPVLDSEMLTISYEHPFVLMKDLRNMGETNPLNDQHKGCSARELFSRMAEHYHKHYSDDEGRITASVELLTLTAWSPHHSQQKPAKRGSGKISLTDVL